MDGLQAFFVRFVSLTAPLGKPGGFHWQVWRIITDSRDPSPLAGAAYRVHARSLQDGASARRIALEQRNWQASPPPRTLTPAFCLAARMDSQPPLSFLF